MGRHYGAGRRLLEGGSKTPLTARWDPKLPGGGRGKAISTGLYIPLQIALTPLLALDGQPPAQLQLLASDRRSHDAVRHRLRRPNAEASCPQRQPDLPAHRPPAREHRGQVPAIYAEVSGEFTYTAIGSPVHSMVGKGHTNRTCHSIA
jgi:hypothetical protein